MITQARSMGASEEAGKELRLVNQKLDLMNIVAWHDIQNKITALRGYVELSKGMVQDEKAQEYLSREEEMLKTIHEHIQHTKEYYEMGEQPQQWVDIPQTLRRVLSLIDKKGITVTSDIGELKLFCDPVIEKAFFHLFDHTLSRSHGATTVRITAKESPAGLLLVYEDNGSGVPDKEKQSIFVRDVAKTSGFGLYFIHDILELSGMAIQETGTPGVSSRFEITVPPASYQVGVSDAGTTGIFSDPTPDKAGRVPGVSRIPAVSPASAAFALRLKAPVMITRGMRRGHPGSL